MVGKGGVRQQDWLDITVAGMARQNDCRHQPNAKAEALKRKGDGAIADATTRDMAGDDDDITGAGRHHALIAGLERSARGDL